MVCASSCFVICHISSACRAEQPRYTTSRDAVQAGASGLRSVELRTQRLLAVLKAACMRYRDLTHVALVTQQVTCHISWPGCLTCQLLYFCLLIWQATWRVISLGCSVRTLEGQSAPTAGLLTDLRKHRQHMVSHQQHPARSAGASLMTAICAGEDPTSHGAAACSAQGGRPGRTRAACLSRLWQQEKAYVP